MQQTWLVSIPRDLKEECSEGNWSGARGGGKADEPRMERAALGFSLGGEPEDSEPFVCF